MNKIAYFAMKLACRSYFTVMDLGSKMIPFPSAEIRMGCGSRRVIPEAVKSCGIKKVMVVTGPVVGATAAKPIIQALRDSGIAYELFDRVESNPPRHHRGGHQQQISVLRLRRFSRDRRRLAYRRSQSRRRQDRLSQQEAFERRGLFQGPQKAAAHYCRTDDLGLGQRGLHGVGHNGQGEEL